MEENQTPPPEYQKGFNEGYLIAKNEPGLAEKLSRVKGETPYLEGFKDGQSQHALEQKKERYPSWLKDDRLAALRSETDPSKDMDKDDHELSKE